MAYSTQVFTYVPRQIVVVLSGNSTRHFMPQYSKTLTIHKGVDNRLQFQFLNQEQKPVSVLGKTITCRIINYDGTKVLITKALTADLPVTGIMSLYLTASEVENITSQKASYSLEIPENSFDFPVFIDQNGGARGEVNIIDSVLPSFVPSQEVTIPTGQPFPNVYNDANTKTYFSSVIRTQENPILTIQAQFNDYIGNVEIEGSTEVDANWYQITQESYANTSETQGYTIIGFHPYVRVKFVSEQGEVDHILAR